MVPQPAIRTLLDAQLDTAWRLLAFHLDGLTDDECLWRPPGDGPHVTRDAHGVWRADWPQTEDYDRGPPSIAWLTWHIGFWWAMALDHSFGDGTLAREDVTWPGSADAATAWIAGLHDSWAAAVAGLPDHELAAADRTRWPFTDRPFHRLAGWLNLELMKNAAEIGYGRFLYAVHGTPDGVGSRPIVPPDTVD